MPELITLAEDGPLGKAGTRVWVNDAEESEKPKPAPRKSAAAKRKHDDES